MVWNGGSRQLMRPWGFVEHFRDASEKFFVTNTGRYLHERARTVTPQRFSAP
jgi:hypothetical protein